LALAKFFNARRACLCQYSPSCDLHGFTGELLAANGIQVTNYPP
jgi:hypothetical protein